MSSSIRLILLQFLGFTHFLMAQGPLDPPAGAPGDTMKTLQQLWDKIEVLEAQIEEMQTFLGAPFSMAMTPVGNAGNTADYTTYGAVSYSYRIGKYEVTNDQYARFLNAVADTDTYSLYNTSMGSDARGGITRSGSSGTYTYAVKANMGDKPVIFTSWYDAVRFCNWLHNGQRTGAQDATTTESGAYTLTGATTIAAGTDPTHGANGRNSGASFWLPSENEWYKAAYHDPVNADADANGTTDYWLYPTKSDSAPTVATTDATGNINNDTVNIANYLSGAVWNGQTGNLTSVGSGGTGSESYYGAADLGGNVWEWNEQIIAGNQRGVRGCSWIETNGSMLPSNRGQLAPDTESVYFGMRVAGAP